MNLIRSAVEDTTKTRFAKLSLKMHFSFINSSTTKKTSWLNYTPTP